MVMLLLIVVSVSGLLGTTWGQNFYIAAPAKLRLNAEQTIGIAIDGREGALLEVYIQDHPKKLKNITHTIIPVQPDEPILFKIYLDPADFPSTFFNSPGSAKLVSVTAASVKFRKEILVPITIQSGYVFIQMDKPIYTPNQRARIRIITLNEDTLPSHKPFLLLIKNPGGFIVEKRFFNKSAERAFKPFDTYIYRFPTYSSLGEWSASVRYGYEFQQETSVYFQLEQYVLPTFTVEVKTPDIILPLTDTIKISVLAQHVYGKSVQGIVTFRIGIKRNSPIIKYFAIISSKELDQGYYEVKISTDNLKKHNDIGWFPAIEGSQLVVEATVVEDATGNREKSVVVNTMFSKSPFVISFKRCLTDFKPGLSSICEADITYVDGKPAEGILTKIKVMADDNKPLNILQDSAVSDGDGKVSFEMQPELMHSSVSVTLETIDPRYVGSQTVGHFVQRKFQSRNNAYISISRSSAQQLQPGDMFSKHIFYEPGRIQDDYYMIISKGKIIALNKFPAGQFKVKTLRFQITHEMVPFFRLVVFAHYRGEFIADSLKVDVRRVCDPNAEITVVNEFFIEEPGSAGRINLHGTSGTWVGLISVDESVYFLSKKGLLTKAKMFHTFASHDFGCGPGGGLSVTQVLQNAGIIIGTNHYTPTLVSANGTGLENQRCALEVQEDTLNRNFRVRKSIHLRQLEVNNNYSKVLENRINERQDCRHRRDLYEDFEFIEIEDEDLFEMNTLIRNYFRETHIFDDIRIGSDGERSYGISLPHSITTWVVSAVSVSPQYGMCVAEPQKLVSFKKIFLNLNLPYSAIRNQQIEIQAIVFNHGERLISATVYMYGVKDFCTGAQPGQKSERQRLVINPHSSKSVIFPVIPLKVQIFRIKVVLLTPEGSDVVEKYLRVLPEGVTEEIQTEIKLDPTNSQQRQRIQIGTDVYTDRIISSNSHQVTAVKLQYPENFIPGTASCWITAIGDKMVEAVVKTNISNPDALLQKPQGSGEQNMVLLAPTLYTMSYLKATGKITAAREAKGYEFILTGYINQLSFKKQDGTYAASLVIPTSTWLTTFVMKVFSQLNKLIPMDKDALCSGVRWLINTQGEDGSYVEKNLIDDRAMMGGVQGSIPMTAFVLIALEESKCHGENIIESKNRAVTYLEEHLSSLREPFPLAIVTYALVLSDSELKRDANNKLLSMAKNNKDENLMYWETQNSAHDIETTSYGLLTQLFFNDMKKISSIVNWLNTKQLQSGSGKFTQDTVIALQSLSEYATHTKMTRSINLVSNITSSNDRNFGKTLVIDDTNANVLQDIKIDKIGGTLLINTVGYGVANLTVNMRYNRIPPLECKFDVTVEVSEAKKEGDEAEIAGTPKPIDIFSFPEEKTPNLESGDNIGAVPASSATPKNNEEGTPDLESGSTVGAVPASPATPENREAICEMPLAPDHGSLYVVGALKVSSLALYQCDDARKLVGASVSKCLFTGEWTSPPPKCVDKSRVRRQVPVQDTKLKFIISICTKYLGYKDAEMSIVDVGIFSGYQPDVSKLAELKSDPNHLIQRYEKSSKSIVFHLQKVPAAEEYCFSFPVIRQYIASHTHIGVIKVYDYDNPDETCNKWYTSPGSDSPLLRTICEGGICECAEGGCPSDQALLETVSLDRSARRAKLTDIICNNYDYVWKGKLDRPAISENGFLNISFTIEDVIKEGTEKGMDIEGESRILISRDNCPEMFLGLTYLIIGKDGQKYMDNQGVIWYRYILDQTSIVYFWTSVSKAQNPDLHRALLAVTRKLSSQGCLLL